jgi:hypothetical protein
LLLDPSVKECPFCRGADGADMARSLVIPGQTLLTDHEKYREPAGPGGRGVSKVFVANLRSEYGRRGGK